MFDLVLKNMFRRYCLEECFEDLFEAVFLKRMFEQLSETRSLKTLHFSKELFRFSLKRVLKTCFGALVWNMFPERHILEHVVIEKYVWTNTDLLLWKLLLDHIPPPHKKLPFSGETLNFPNMSTQIQTLMSLKSLSQDFWSTGRLSYIFRSPPLDLRPSIWDPRVKK